MWCLLNGLVDVAYGDLDRETWTEHLPLGKQQGGWEGLTRRGKQWENRTGREL